MDGNLTPLEASTITADVLRRRLVEVGVIAVPMQGRSMGERYSMEGVLHVQHATRTPRLGEVWLFVDVDDRLVAHRCWGGSTPRGWRFRGDAELRWDRRVSSVRLVGPIFLVEQSSRRWRPRLWHVLPSFYVAATRAIHRRFG